MPSSGLITCLRPYLDKLTGAGMSFQILSDLHLEYCSQYTTFHVPTQAPYLVLAGNVGQLKDYQLYLDFLANACAHFKRVFLVLGTKELYGLNREQARAHVDRLQQEPAVAGRLSILDRTRFDLASRLTVLGCTLFSHLSLDAHESIMSKVEDFQRIPDWTAQQHVQAHQEDVEWLQREIVHLRKQRGLDHKILVVTNFAPLVLDTTPGSRRKTAGASISETQLLENGSELDTVQGWVFGRTGESCNQVVGKVHLVSNQRGMVTPFEDDNTTSIRGIGPLMVKKAEKTKKSSEFNVRQTIRL